MDFLKELALPQSLEHYRLVILLGTISALVFLPYISFVLGSTILSLWYHRKGRMENNDASLRFARTVIDVALYNKSLAVYLGIIPALSVVFSYAQVLHATAASAAGVAGVGFLLMAAGLALLFTYKHTLRVKSLIDTFEKMTGSGSADDEVRAFKASNIRVKAQSGQYGLMCLVFGMFFFSASHAIASDAGNWNSMTSLFDSFLSGAVWVRFGLFLGMMLGVTGFGVLFFFSVWEGGLAAKDPDVARIASRVGGMWSILALLEIPVLMLGSVALVAPGSSSGSVYALAGISIALFFAAAHFLYGYHRTTQPTYLSTAFFVFLVGLTVSTVNDHVVLSGGTKANAVYLASVHARHIETLKAKLGVGAPAPTGEDIYNAKCSACHTYDQKKVGPPYFETIPKYAGKKAELIGFILNPQKINPAYTSMPSQGLRQSEADSIASFIMRKVAAAGKMKPEPPQTVQK